MRLKPLQSALSILIAAGDECEQGGLQGFQAHRGALHILLKKESV